MFRQLFKVPILQSRLLPFRSYTTDEHSIMKIINRDLRSSFLKYNSKEFRRKWDNYMESEIEPDEEMFSLGMSFFLKQGRFGMAKLLLEKFKSKDFKCTRANQPFLEDFYGDAIIVFKKTGGYEQVMELKQTMLDQGLVIRLPVAVALAEVHMVFDQVEEIYDLTNEAVNSMDEDHRSILQLISITQQTMPDLDRMTELLFDAIDLDIVPSYDSVALHIKNLIPLQKYHHVAGLHNAFCRLLGWNNVHALSMVLKYHLYQCKPWIHMNSLNVYLNGGSAHPLDKEAYPLVSEKSKCDYAYWANDPALIEEVESSTEDSRILLSISSFHALHKQFDGFESVYRRISNQTDRSVACSYALRMFKREVDGEEKVLEYLKEADDLPLTGSLVKEMILLFMNQREWDSLKALFYRIKREDPLLFGVIDSCWKIFRFVASVLDDEVLKNDVLSAIKGEFETEFDTDEIDQIEIETDEIDQIEIEHQKDEIDQIEHQKDEIEIEHQKDEIEIENDLILQKY